RQSLALGSGQKLAGITQEAFVGILPKHLHVAAERQQRQPVVGVPPLDSEQTWSEADGKDLHLDAEELGHDEMAQLVDQHQRPQEKRKGQKGLRIQERVHAATPFIRICSARRREASSASRIVASESAATGWCSSRTFSMVRGMSKNFARRARNAPTATSLAALRATGAVPPASNAPMATPRQGKRRRSGAQNSRAGAVDRSSQAKGDSQRSGKVRAYWIGPRISGVPSWQMTEPSLISTRECTRLCGWRRTWILADSIPNSQWASMISSPLFIKVEESTDIFGPISQVGCRSACSGPAASISSRLDCRKGPPEAVRISRLTSSRRSP